MRKNGFYQKYIMHPNIDDFCVFTDGAAKENKENAHAGFGIYIPKYGGYKYGKYMKGTNNQAELEAIRYTLYLLAKKQDFPTKNVYICTDSQYSITVINSSKKYDKNMEKIAICRELLKLANETYNVSFFHVMAHTGKQDFISKSNAEADNIASWCAANKKDYLHD